MCDPTLVTIIKMQSHNSQSSRENATPSSGTYPLACYWEVPPPPLPGLSSLFHKLKSQQLFPICNSHSISQKLHVQIILRKKGDLTTKKRAKYKAEQPG